MKMKDIARVTCGPLTRIRLSAPPFGGRWPVVQRLRSYCPRGVEPPWETRTWEELEKEIERLPKAD